MREGSDVDERLPWAVRLTLLAGAVIIALSAVIPHIA